jgi:hypothetical protein
VFAASHNQRIDPLRQIGDVPTRTILEQLPLVVIDGYPAGLLHESAQLGAVEHRQPLAGIEYERDCEPGKVSRVRDHPVAPVR